MSDNTGVSARYVALQALAQWRKNSGHYVSQSIDRADLPDNEKGLAREIALGVVRFQRLYRAVIIACLDKTKPEPLLVDILSIAAHQIFSLDAIPDHAIGQTSVALAEKAQRKGLKGVVNAVVRRLLEMRDPSLSGLRIKPQHLPKKPADLFSFEPDFIRALQKDFPKQWRQIAGSLNQVVPVCTRWRSAAYEDRLQALDASQIAHQDGPFVWWHNVQDALRGPLADGSAVVQDRSQAYVIEYAAIQAGDLVLDYCAAPGGKTAAALDAGARVISADVQRDKVQQMQGTNPLHCLVQDGLHPACAAIFDCVLVDAPCSNSGVFARRPEARWRYKSSAVKELISLQVELLQAASTLVKEGGRLVYATCSINSNENMAVCQQLAGWQVEAVHLSKPNQWQAGGFVARLVRC